VGERRSTDDSTSSVAVAVVLGLAIVATASGCRDKSHASPPEPAATKAARSCTAKTVLPDADARKGFVFQPRGPFAEGVIRFENHHPDSMRSWREAGGAFLTLGAGCTTPSATPGTASAWAAGRSAPPGACKGFPAYRVVELVPIYVPS
jgi:hypothetical protein